MNYEMKGTKDVLAEKAEFSSGYLRYVIVMLFLVNVINLADRTIMSVLIESIRLDMHLTDGQIGLLSGFAFALFYAVAGIFIARMADLHDRRIVLGVSILAWSALTAITGAVHSFWQFFLARMGVGVGEAGAVPISNAMIGDYFPPEHRSLAHAVFIAGSFIGVFVGSLIGGYVGDAYGWRIAFVAAALPGVPIALLVFATLRDPRCNGDGKITTVDASTLGGTLRTLAKNNAFVFLSLSCGFLTFMVFGLITWFPAFLMRTHGLEQATVGLYFGTTLGVGMACGSVLGGLIANVLAKRSLRWLTGMPLILSFLFIPLYEIAIFASNSTVSLIFIGAAAALGGATLGPALGAIQTVLNPSMRAMGASVTGFSASLIGLGLAPFLVGILSDYFTPEMGAAAGLQTALAVTVLMGVVASLMLFCAHRSFGNRIASQIY